MPRRHLLTFCLLFLVAGATASAAGELLLYTPRPVTVERAPSPDEGVLVKTVTVKRGDTLAKLSKKHIGVAGWFPQMLVFNTIKNPDLIHPGDKLLVPVRAGKAASQKETAAVRKQKISRRSAPRVKPAAAVSPRERGDFKPGEQESFLKAQLAYQNRDYQKALQKFSDFLRRYPRSRFASDAALYRANCFLHLSGE